MNIRMRPWLGIVSLAAPLCAQPVLERMQPRGAQVGSAVRLVVSGKRLGPAARLISAGQFAATPLTGAPTEGPMPAAELVYLVEVAQDAPPGRYPLRIETANGLSNALLFTVGEFPQVQELESDPEADAEDTTNDFRETAQSISAPVTVEGRLQGPERDVFRLHAKAGQRFVAEVAARRAGSAIDPNLELLDGEGLTLARSSDAPGLGLDSRLTFDVPEDGEYFLSLRDERFSTQQDDFYRLTLGEYSFADGVFPLGWTRGSQTQAEFFGGNLNYVLKHEVDLRNVPGNVSKTWLRVPGTPSFVPFLLSDGAEVLESESDGALGENVVMNGRIARSGEIDRYRLAVQGGEQWALELRSGELPGSSLYGVMTIADGDSVLAIAGKYAGDPNPYIITTTGETATYPFVNLTVPPGVDELLVSVEDLLQRGGRDYSYRLVARKQGPDFLLTLNEPYVNIPQDGSAVLTVTAERRGYHGPIQLYVEDPPDDLVVTGGHIAPMSTLGNTLPRFETGRLTLTSKPGAEMRLLNLVVRGKAEQDGAQHLDSRATGPGVRVQVKGTKQPAVTAEWLGYDLPARINPEQGAQLKFVTPRQLRLVRGGQGLLTKWTFQARLPGARLAKKVQIPRNAGSVRLRRTNSDEVTESGEFQIFTHERTSLGMVNFNLAAEISLDGRDETIYSQPLEIDVVDGYTLASPESQLVLGVGSAGRWEGSIWRDPEFRRTVKVSAVGLPSGVQCAEAELAEDQTHYALQCNAESGAPEGQYEVEIRAESMLSDEGTTRYLAEPAKATLAIRR